MSDCTITEVFLNEWRRMCDANAIFDDLILRDCKKCDAYEAAKSKGACHCQVFFQNLVPEAISFVQKWSDDHPIEPDEPKYPIRNDIDPAPNKTVEPAHNLRLCEIVNESNEVMCRGVFHGFFTKSEIIPPSHLMGGHTGGVVSEPIALVEKQNGHCVYAYANRINFLDGLAKRFIEDQEEQNR